MLRAAKIPLSKELLSDISDARLRALLSDPTTERRFRTAFRFHKHRTNKPSPDGRILRGEPQTAASLKFPPILAQYLNLYRIILGIFATKYPVIPREAEIYSSDRNLMSIFSKEWGILYGAKTLLQMGIKYDRNCMEVHATEDGYDFGTDGRNLDDDSSCFAAGGYVDSRAYANPNQRRFRLRIDVTKVSSWNMFFKIRDLGMPDEFYPEIQLTDDLKINFLFNVYRADLDFKFTFKGRETSVVLDFNDYVFYGDIHNINRFCILFPFIALEKSGDEELIRAIYEHLNNLNPHTLRKIFIGQSQILTGFSELNFFHALHLTPHAVVSLHDLKTDTTYHLTGLTTATYRAVLDGLGNADTFYATLALLPCSKETVVSEEGITVDEAEYRVEKVYGRVARIYAVHFDDPELDANGFNIDLRRISDDLFNLNAGYVEIRSHRQLTAYGNEGERLTWQPAVPWTPTAEVHGKFAWDFRLAVCAFLSAYKKNAKLTKLSAELICSVLKHLSAYFPSSSIRCQFFSKEARGSLFLDRNAHEESGRLVFK